jgi:Ca2+-binding EF-hand superfamily protein
VAGRWLGGAGGMMGAPGAAAATDPHKVFSSEVDAHTSSLTHTHFDKYDSDADRVMTKDELAKLVHAQEGPDGPVTAARVDQWMSYYDLNNDGVVDPQEWAYRVREDRLQQLVANTDGDADGQMTAAEMLAAGHDQASVSRFMAEHDINGDGKLSASEILTLHTHTEAEASFREHDTDKDGFITTAELGALQSNETVASWFARYDTDHDGKVSLRDMAKVDYEADTRASFDAHDMDHDGMLDFDEIAASMNMTKTDEATAEQEQTRHDFIESHIKRFDADGDGKVSYAEGWGAFNKRMVELVSHKQEL